jgi:tryptophan synthase beta chain
MALDDETTRIGLDERDLQTHWYNVVPDLPSPPAPPLHPETGQPLGPADLAPPSRFS